MTGKRQR